MKAKILIGGQALRNLGSDRYTDDVDYLNANGNDFFAEIFNIESGNKQASVQSLLDLKCYAFVQHCQNFNFAKADSCEYDIKFLVRNFNISPKIVKKYISLGELSEIEKIIINIKK